MGIIIKWAELSKGYYYGEFLQHKPGLGCEITGDTTEDEALDMLEKLLDKWHTKKTSGTPFEALKPETVTAHNTQVINIQDEKTEIEIDNCVTLEELIAWKSCHDVLPGKIVAYYTKRLKELNPNG